MSESRADIRDAYVDGTGGRVYVRRWTPPEAHDASPLVLLHDSLGCVALWRDFPARLAAALSRPVFAYDRLGFGRSGARRDLPSPHFVQEEADVFFPVLRQALGIGRYALFGHSVGGAMALAIAASDPAGCEAVVSESAQAFVEGRTVAGIQAARASFERPGEIDRLARWHGDHARWVLRAWTEVWLSPAFASWSLEATLPLVRCPVLALHGSRDEYGSVAFPEMICRLSEGPCEMAVLEGCGHVPHREREAEVLDRVSRFFQGAAA